MLSLYFIFDSCFFLFSFLFLLLFFLRGVNFLGKVARAGIRRVHVGDGRRSGGSHASGAGVSGSGEVR